MNLIEIIKNEFLDEVMLTKKFIDLYPEDQAEYKPHEKSRTLQQLMNHIINIFSWPNLIIDTKELNIEKNSLLSSKLEMREQFNNKLVDVVQALISKLARTDQDILIDQHWALLKGDDLIIEWTKYGALRYALNQITHHRAQLGLYYRLLGISVPATYGPSADDLSFPKSKNN